MNKLTKSLVTLLFVIALVALSQVAALATTTVSQLDGNNGLNIRMTAAGDTYSGNVMYGTVTGVRINTIAGAKSYNLTALGLNKVIWTGYGNGFSAATTSTIESRIPFRCPRGGLKLYTDDASPSFTLDLYMLP